MKHLKSIPIFLTTALLLVLFSCDEGENNKKGAWVTLDLSAIDFDEVIVRRLNEQLTFQNHDTLSVQNQKDKIFKMALVEGEDFGYYFLTFSKSPKTLILSPNEKVVLKKTLEDSTNEPVNPRYNTNIVQIDAEGSKETERMERIIAVNAKYMKIASERVKILEDSLGVSNPLLSKFINNLENEFRKKSEQDILSIVNEDKHSFSNLYALELLDPEKNEALFQEVYNYFKDKTYLSKMLLPKIEKLAVNRIGSKAIDFSLPDLNKKMIDLKEFKGKYVMLDFWASWCRPCRDENPNVKKAYEKYKNKGFEVVGISTDRSSIPWKKAIKDDKLTWKQLIDSTGSVSAKIYKVNFIPYSILLNPQGEIIAKNLRGHLLEEKLAELFGNDS